MTKKISVGVSGAYKDVSSIKVGVSGSWKTVSNAWVGVSGAWKQVFPALAPLSATASPSSQTWTGSLGSYSTPGSFTVSASGGSGNYTYAWEQDGGAVPISIDSDTSAWTGCTSATNDAASIRCLVSDDAGSTPVYSNSVSIDP